MKRLLSLDVFRGLTIAFMILVNTPGSWSHVFPPLLHAKWHGCTPTDLVFPFFVFIVGVSMYMSFKQFNYTLTKAATQKILRRTALIFLIGLLLNWFPFYHQSISDLRIMGVLQRIALAYGMGAFVCLAIKDRKPLIAAGIGILLLYWGLMVQFGGAAPFDLETNFARTVDLMILGEAHVYGGFGVPFDPEGLLSSLPAVGTVVMGYLTGSLIQSFKSKPWVLVRNLVGFGASCIIIALLWDSYFPINKPLWTSSYVLYTGGIAMVVLALCMVLIDIFKLDFWTKPFVVFGTNPLFAYVLSGVLVKLMIYVFRWTNDAGEAVNMYGWLWTDIYTGISSNLKLGSFLFGISVVATCWFFTWLLYRKSIFVKI